jgi:hypothetical protein
MRIDKEQLKQIILKEIKQNLSEQWKPTPCKVGSKSCFVWGSRAKFYHLSDKQISSATMKRVAYLGRGTPLEVLERRDGFFRVKTKDGEEGWVSVRVGSENLPSDEERLKGLEPAATARASGLGVSVTAGARG